MSEDVLDRIAVALERIANSLEDTDADKTNFYERVSDISRALFSLDEKGINTYEQNDIKTYEQNPQ